MSDVLLECNHCGKMAYMSRTNMGVPSEVSHITMNECDRCNAASGGYGEEWWWDDDGREVKQFAEDGQWRGSVVPDPEPYGEKQLPGARGPRLPDTM